jgi:DivIVA domain-containing protein
MRRKKAEQPDTPTHGARVTPNDVQQIEFRLAFRGYNERDVDAFLDRLTEDLAWYLEENQRLRTQAGAPVPLMAQDELGAARAEAEEILAAARLEAAEIVRRAERESAAVAATPASGDARSAVAPFLNTEREFLQSLGALVQGHAEEIKQMVLALRARAESAAEGARVPEPAATDVATAAEIRERLGTPEPPPQPAREPEPERVIDLATEPAYSSEGSPAGDGGERSLRELFWGDD